MTRMTTDMKNHNNKADWLRAHAAITRELECRENMEI